MIWKPALIIFVTLLGLTFWVEDPITVADYSSLITIVPVEHGYIREDGSIEPSTLPIERSGNQYSLKADISNYSIVIQKSNITFDGNGFTLALPHSVGFWGLGNSADALIQIQDIHNVIIENTRFNNYFTGISIANSSEITILGNNLTNGSSSIELRSSWDCDILGNNLTENPNTGLFAKDSTNLNIAYNNISKNNNGCIFVGLTYSNITRNNVMNNSIWGGPNHGLFTLEVANNRIFENNFVNNPVAIYFSGQNCSFNNLIYRNYFYDNNKDIINTGGDAISGTNESPLETPLFTSFEPQYPIPTKDTAKANEGAENGTYTETIVVLLVFVVIFLIFVIGFWYYRRRQVQK